jgi:energy-coupling factor transporter ATP-binding protein EcfA2
MISPKRNLFTLYASREIFFEISFAKNQTYYSVKLTRLTIQNFKSLGDVTITPNDLSVIIGPNGSGKTNLAHAFAFVRDVYKEGLGPPCRKVVDLRTLFRQIIIQG